MLQSEVQDISVPYGEILMKLYDEEKVTEHLLVWLAIAACVNRQIALVSAMPLLFDDRNIYALMPLVRLQLEGALRLHAFCVVDDPGALAHHLLIKGKESKEYKKNKYKNALSDSSLAKSLGESLVGRLPMNSVKDTGNSGIHQLYRILCGWVHFSDQHFLSLMQEGEERNDGIPNINLNVGGYKTEVYEARYDMLVSVIPFIHQATLLVIEDLFQSLSLTLH